MTNGEINAPSQYEHIYNGVGTVPWNTTRVRVASSVTIIPERAFEDFPHLQEVKLPEGLIVIGGRAFYHCISLKRVNIPSTVKEIGKEAFAWCDKLETVGRLPNGLEVLGSYAFRVCKSLQTINIPPRVKSIKMGTFLDCCSLTEVSFTYGLLSIGQSAFRGCISLVSINLPSVQVVGDLAFENCKGLNEIHLPDTVERIGTETFHNCIFQNFQLPPRVTKVDIGIFTRRNCLVSLELSENVKWIEDSVASTSFNFLRNIAFECQVNTGVFGRCQDLGMAFPSGSSDAISDALKHRFDDLPIHKICYYQSYHPTETVMQNLKREINPWTLSYLGQLNATGKQQDCLGMTPLHILACSTKQNVEMYRLLIEKYPETLIMKDKWGDIPLVYAVWCNAPMDIIQLLVEGYKSYYPDYVFDWAGMIQTLAKGNALLANIQNLINTQQCSFPEQSFDMYTVVMELASSDARQATFHRPCTCVETFQYLLRASMANRLDTLGVKRWFVELERGIDALHERPANYRNFDTRVLYARLELYESIKEATSVLELTLWKTKIDELVSTNNGTGKVAEVGDAISLREQCRINCGASIVVHNVLPYLLPK